MKSVNRLFIIGNGFDLAHGMKTTYKDFLIDLISKCYNRAIESNLHNEDDFLTIAKNISSEEAKDIKLFEEKLLEKTFIRKGQWQRDHFRRYSINEPFALFCSDHLIHSLISNIPKNWVDIEVYFYRLLLTTLKSNTASFLTISDLNTSINRLKSKLRDYLNRQKAPTINKELLDIFKNEDYDAKSPKQSLILNFNYTGTIGSYMPHLNDPLQPFHHIQIHGYYVTDDIILGYGDEMDKHYSEIEDLNNNAYLQNIKSFGYGQNSKYWQMLDFLDKDTFDVYIMGHSCGLSDRVMLSKIFERSNCRKIKIFYNPIYGIADHLDKYQNISRHFHNKELHRERVFPFDKSKPFPQT